MRKREIRKLVKRTEKMLIATLLSIGFSVICLVGSTYAWFTASVESGVNVIKTGAFDVDITWSKTYGGDYNTLSGTNIFADDNISPGGTLIRYIKISNDSDYPITISASLDFNNLGTGNDDLSSLLTVYYKQGVTAALDVSDMTAQNTVSALQEAAGSNYKYVLSSDLSLPEHTVSGDTTTPLETIIAVAFTLDSSAGAELAGVAQSRFKLNIMAVQNTN